LVMRRTRHFVHEDTAIGLEHEVGIRAADINTNPHHKGPHAAPTQPMIVSKDSQHPRRGAILKMRSPRTISVGSHVRCEVGRVMEYHVGEGL